MKLYQAISILVLILLLGPGCPTPKAPPTPAASDATPSAPVDQVKEPFDTNDYLDAALADLEAVE